MSIAQHNAMASLLGSVGSALVNLCKAINRPLNALITNRMFKQPGVPYCPRYGLVSLVDSVPHLIDVATSMELIPRSECLEDCPEPSAGTAALDSFHNVIQEPIIPDFFCIILLFIIIILVSFACNCRPAVIQDGHDEDDDTNEAKTRPTTSGENLGSYFENLKVKSSWEKSFAALGNGQDEILGTLLSWHSDSKRRDREAALERRNGQDEILGTILSWKSDAKRRNEEDFANLKRGQEKIIDMLSTQYSGTRSEDKENRSRGTQTVTLREENGTENEDSETQGCDPSQCHKCPKFRDGKHHICEHQASESDAVAWREWQISQIINQAQQLVNAVALLPKDGMSDGETSVLDRLKDWVQEEATYSWDELTALSNRRLRDIAEQLLSSADGIQRWQGRYNACLEAKIKVFEESRQIDIAEKDDQREVLEESEAETEVSDTDEEAYTHFLALQARIDRGLQCVLDKVHAIHCQGRDHQNELNKAHKRILEVQSQLSQANRHDLSWIEFQDFWEIILDEILVILARVREHFPQCTTEDCKHSENCNPRAEPVEKAVERAPKSTPKPPERKQEHWVLAQPEYDQTFPNGHEAGVSRAGNDAIVETIEAMHADDPQLGRFALELWKITIREEFEAIPSGSEEMIQAGLFTAEQLSALVRIWGNERNRNVQLGRYVEGQNEPLVARNLADNKHDALIIWIQENIANTDKHGRQLPARWSAMKPNPAEKEESKGKNTTVRAASGSNKGDGPKAERPAGPSTQTVSGSAEGSAQTSPPRPSPSETLTASEVAWNQWNRDFPRGSRTIETSSVGLRCGIFAVLNTVKALNLGIEGLSESSLMDVVRNDPVYLEQVRVFGAMNESHFSIHQLALIVSIWGFNHRIPLRLAYVAQDDVPILSPHPDPDGALIIWVYNDNAEELNLSRLPRVAGSVPYSHYSGLRPATQDEYDNESADVAREERRKVESLIEALPPNLPGCLDDHGNELRSVNADIRSLRKELILLRPTDEGVGSSNRGLVNSLRRMKNRADFLVESILSAQSACRAADCPYRTDRTGSEMPPPSRQGASPKGNPARTQVQSALSPIFETLAPPMGQYRTPLSTHTDSTKASSSSSSRINSPPSPCLGPVEGVDDTAARLVGLNLSASADLAGKKQKEKPARESKQAENARLAKEAADRQHAEEAHIDNEKETKEAAEAERQRQEQIAREQKAERVAKAEAFVKGKNEARKKAAAEAQAAKKAEADAKAAKKAEADAQAASKVEAETKAQAAKKVEADAKVAKKAEADAQAASKVEAETKTQAAKKVEADAKAAKKAEADAQAAKKAEAEAKAQAAKKAEADARAAKKAEAEAKAQAAKKAEADRKREHDQRLAQEQQDREEAARLAASNSVQIPEDVVGEEPPNLADMTDLAMAEAWDEFQNQSEQQQQLQQDDLAGLMITEGWQEFLNQSEPPPLYQQEDVPDLPMTEDWKGGVNQPEPQPQSQQPAQDTHEADGDFKMLEGESEISDTLSPRFAREIREQFEREQNSKGKERAVPDTEMEEDGSPLSSLNSSVVAQLESMNMDTEAKLPPGNSSAQVTSNEQAMTDAPLHVEISVNDSAQGGLQQQQFQSQIIPTPPRSPMIRLRMGPPPQMPEVPPATPNLPSGTEDSMDEGEVFEDVKIDPPRGETYNTNRKDHTAESQGPSKVPAVFEPSPIVVDVIKYIIEEKEPKSPASEAATLEIIPDPPVPDSELLPVPKAQHERHRLRPVTAAERRQLREQRAATIAAKTGQSIEGARAALAKSEKEIVAAREAKKKAEKEEDARKLKEAARKKFASQNAEYARKIRKEERYTQLRDELSGAELKKAYQKLSLEKRIRKKLDKEAGRNNDETTSESDADDSSTPDVSESEYPYLTDEERNPVRERVCWSESSEDESPPPPEIRAATPDAPNPMALAPNPSYLPPSPGRAPSIPIPQQFISPTGQVQSPMFAVSDEMRRAAMQGAWNQGLGFNVNQRPSPSANMSGLQSSTLLPGQIQSPISAAADEMRRAAMQGARNHGLGIDFNNWPHPNDYMRGQGTASTSNVPMRAVESHAEDTPAEEAMKAAAEASGYAPIIPGLTLLNPPAPEEKGNETKLYLLPSSAKAEDPADPPLLSQIKVKYDKRLESSAPRSKTGSGCQDPYCLDKHPHDCYDAFDSDEIDEDDSANEGSIVNPKKPVKKEKEKEKKKSARRP